MASPGYPSEYSNPVQASRAGGGGMPISGILSSSSETHNGTRAIEYRGDAASGPIPANETSFSTTEGRDHPIKPINNLEILAHSIPQSPPHPSLQASPDQTISQHPSPDEARKRSSQDDEETSGMMMDDGEEDAAMQGYRKRKRLSINTSLGDSVLPQRFLAGGGSGVGPGGAGSNSGGATTAKEAITGSSYAGSATPVSRDVYEKTLMVKQQQKALIEARNLKQAKPAPAPQYVPVTASTANTIQATGEGPASALPSANDSQKPASIPVRRNSLRNLKIMTPNVSVEALGGQSGAPRALSSAVPSTETAGSSMANGGLPPPSHSVTHPAQPPPPPPPSTIQQHQHQHPQQHQQQTSSLSSPRLPPPHSTKPLAPRYTPVMPNSHSAVASPRSEFPSRDLPLPMSSSSSSSQFDQAPPRSPHPIFGTDRGGLGGGGGKAPMPPKSPSSAYPMSAAPMGMGGGGGGFGNVSRQTFVGAFESLYDSAEELPRLSSQLREQIRRSSSLLQTLQASGAMIEGLVRGLFREMQAQYGEKFGAALADLNRRLIVVEEMNGVVATGGGGGAAASSSSSSTAPAIGGDGNHGFRGLGPPTPYIGGGGGSAALGIGKGFAANDIILKSLVERIEALEKKSEP
ncbi:hypothetical protein HDU67_001571 [Dinochytrium kinnereticum]|nr:hypothetical protein HDU67_001571 [Dinochytrium kinnereticum]